MPSSPCQQREHRHKHPHPPPPNSQSKGQGGGGEGAIPKELPCGACRARAFPRPGAQAASRPGKAGPAPAGPQPAPAAGSLLQRLRTHGTAAFGGSPATSWPPTRSGIRPPARSVPSARAVPGSVPSAAVPARLRQRCPGPAGPAHTARRRPERRPHAPTPAPGLGYRTHGGGALPAQRRRRRHGRGRRPAGHPAGRPEARTDPRPPPACPRRRARRGPVPVRTPTRIWWSWFVRIIPSDAMFAAQHRTAGGGGAGAARAQRGRGRGAGPAQGRGQGTRARRGARDSRGARGAGSANPAPRARADPQDPWLPGADSPIPDFGKGKRQIAGMVMIPAPG